MADIKDPIKYVKSPSIKSQRYIDEEFRKIETSFGGLLQRLLGELEMATAESAVFTPTIEGITTPGVGTYTIRYAKYFRWGKLVVVQFRVQTTAHTGTGQARLINLPYNVTAENGAGTGFWVAPIFGAGAVALAVAATKNLQFYTHATSAAINITNAMDFIGTLSYLTDD